MMVWCCGSDQWPKSSFGFVLMENPRLRMIWAIDWYPKILVHGDLNILNQPKFGIQFCMLYFRICYPKKCWLRMFTSPSLWETSTLRPHHDAAAKDIKITAQFRLVNYWNPAIYTYTHTHIHIHIHIHIHNACMHAWMHARRCISIYIHIYIYVCIYIYMHTVYIDMYRMPQQYFPTNWGCSLAVTSYIFIHF